MPKKHTVQYPHDSSFKGAMQDLRVAKEFFTHYLPENIQRLISLGTLELQNSTYIDRDLHATASDVLYRVELADELKAPAFLYVLIEAQTNPDKWLPFRMLGYVVQIIQQHIKQQKAVVDKLPLVFPVIFYTGKDKYHHPVNTLDLFHYPALAKHMLIGQYKLIDLKNLDDDVLLTHQWTGLLELFLKHAKTRDAVNLVIMAQQLIKSLLQLGANNYVSSMLKYLISEGEVDDVDTFINILRHEVIEPFTEMEGEVMTIAEQLKQKGRQEGMQQGVQQGMQKKAEEITLRMHAQGFSEQAIQLATNLSTETICYILQKTKSKH